jgi:NADH-quinone oxidoreductase subunit L
MGLLIAWLVYYRRSLSVSSFTESSAGKALLNFWHSGWAMDKLYAMALVTPFVGTANAMKDEWLDKFYHGVVSLNQGLHRSLASLQSGRTRWYATSMVLGLIVLVTVLGWSIYSGGAA